MLIVLIDSRGFSIEPDELRKELEKRLKEVVVVIPCFLKDPNATIEVFKI